MVRRPEPRMKPRGSGLKIESPSRDLNTGPGDYKSPALPAKPLGHTLLWIVCSKKGGADSPSWFPGILRPATAFPGDLAVVEDAEDPVVGDAGDTAPGVHLQVPGVEREDPVPLHHRAILRGSAVDVLDPHPGEVITGIMVVPEQQPVTRSHTHHPPRLLNPGRP
jgi:hypothetical protein